jgi:Ras family protein A
VTPEQGQAVANRMGATYIECSSKESTGVDQVFELAINTAVAVEDQTRADPGATSGGGGGGGGKGGKKVRKRTCKIL